MYHVIVFSFPADTGIRVKTTDNRIPVFIDRINRCFENNIFSLIFEEVENGFICLGNGLASGYIKSGSYGKQDNN